jgi:hypothetical protein
MSGYLSYDDDSPKGIVESLLVNVRGSYVFADFVVLDTQKEIPLILG